MCSLSAIAHRVGEVAGSNEHHVDSRRGGNQFHILHRFFLFDDDHYNYILVSKVGITLGRLPTEGCQRSAKAPSPVRWIFARGCRLLSQFRSAAKWEDHSQGTR